MNRLFQYFLLLSILLMGACTNPRWMVKDTQTVDPEDNRLVSSSEFPAVSQAPTPEDPVLQIQIMSHQKREYTQKVLMGRYVQDYEMRPFFFTLGVLGAGTAFYIANSNSIKQVDGRLETVTLNAVGGLLAISSILNFKPTGEPRPTGEERLLRTSGRQVKIDTAQVTNTEQNSAVVSIFYDDRLVTENQQYGLDNGQMNISLGSALDELEITDTDPGSATVEVEYSDSTFTFSYPVTSILRPFAKVETSVTELRNAPADSIENVLAELVEGSQLQIVEEIGQEWYRVLYGISENYVSKNDVSFVWRTSDFANKDQVETIPTVPFGRIDVENNIPVLKSSNENGIGLLVGNEEYQDNYSARNYTGRDLQLIETYLEDALGYPASRIHRLDDINNRQPVDSVLAGMKYTATDSSEIFVYLSGYGTFQQIGGDYQPALLLPSDNGDRQSVNLIDLYKAIANLSSESTIIVNNIDFRQSVNSINDNESISLQRLRQPLHNAAITLTSENDGLSILFSSALDQATHIYLGNGEEDKKHHIFPYYFAKALQQRMTTISELFDYLERNVSYTSRKLHDEPEDPVLFGNQTNNLAGE